MPNSVQTAPHLAGAPFSRNLSTGIVNLSHNLSRARNFQLSEKSISEEKTGTSRSCNGQGGIRTTEDGGRGKQTSSGQDEERESRRQVQPGHISFIGLRSIGGGLRSIGGGKQETSGLDINYKSNN